MFESVQQIKNQEKESPSSYYPPNEKINTQSILRPQTSLIPIKEINKLRQLISRAAAGEYFLIHLGDSTECFYECDQDIVYAKLEFIQQIARFFQKKIGKKVIQVRSISGQYKNNMSIFSEMQENKKTYSYFDNMMSRWNQELHSTQKIYTSHDISTLYYECELTPLDDQYYNRSTHFPWIDKRVMDSVEHIGYLKEIANPIAVKIGPDTSIKKLINTINELDPAHLSGRITLIHGLGTQLVHNLLPKLINAVKETQRTVLWSCDPMNGNTEILNSGIKIRKLSNIVEEIKNSFLIHKKLGSQLNSIHLEATHQDIMECLDYNSPPCNSVNYFKKNCNSLTDLRLNYAQTIHVMQCLAKQYISY